MSAHRSHTGMSKLLKQLGAPILTDKAKLAAVVFERDKALMDRARLIEALRDVMRNDKFKAVAEIKARQLLKELGE